jgi:hypothetical protein
MSVLNEPFEVKSLILSRAIKRYPALSNLVTALRTAPSQDDIYCAGNAILMLAQRLDAANAAKKALHNDLDSWR